MDFWNSLLTEKSWRILQDLNKKYEFILIGGWAVYLWTKQHKSKDIDIFVGIKELQHLKQENLIKNDRLKKYEIKIDEIDIDIYVSHFSKLGIPVEDISSFVSKIEGFNVAIPEILLIMKQNAELDRKHSVKGEKDRIDILSLLFFADMDFKKYFSILIKYRINNYIDELISLISAFQDYDALSLTPKEFKLKKKEIIYRLKKL